MIIAGFGPGGRALADRLGIMGVSYSIVELNAATVTRQARLGRRVVFGDASNAEVLETAGLSEADAVIVTIPDDQATLRAIQVARQAAPDVFIGARMQFLSGKVPALSLGADEGTVVEVATAVALEKELLGALSKWMEKRERGAASGA